MVHNVRCPCLGNPGCKLCQGTRSYGYEPGPRGWMPFRCPTCEGTRTLAATDGPATECFTCRGTGNVDPANPPPREGARGFFRNAWKIFFGG